MGAGVRVGKVGEETWLPILMFSSILGVRDHPEPGPGVTVAGAVRQRAQRGGAVTLAAAQGPGGLSGVQGPESRVKGGRQSQGQMTRYVNRARGSGDDRVHFRSPRGHPAPLKPLCVLKGALLHRGQQPPLRGRLGCRSQPTSYGNISGCSSQSSPLGE